MLPKIISGFVGERSEFYVKQGLVENNVLAISGEGLKVDELREWLGFCRNVVDEQGQYSMLIEKADLLSAEAQNILLKPLEEKKPKTEMYLLAQNSSYLLPTILSRCELVTLRMQKQEALYWKDVLQMWKKGPAEIISFAEKFDVDKLQELLLEVLQKVKSEMYNEVNLKRVAIAKIALKTIGETSRSNVNKRMALENFLLSAWKVIKT